MLRPVDLITAMNFVCLMILLKIENADSKSQMISHAWVLLLKSLPQYVIYWLPH